MAGPRFFLRVLAGAVAACALPVLPVCARADSLRADFSPLTLRPRTNAPAIFDIRLHRQGAGLLEGALEITLEAAGDVVHRQRTQELTLAAGTQAFRVITPPLPPHESYGGTEARLRFVTKNGAVDLGRFPAEAASRGTRNFVIAVCDGRGSGVRDAALWQSLRLESAANAGNVLATSPAYLTPEDFPVNPLALFAFDLVLIEGDGFALLREKQLAALTRWVEAGGSVCVLPGRGLKDEHARFLSAFADAKDPAPARLSDTGEWLPADGRARLRRAGLGRAVIAPRPADDALSAEEWKQVAAFLWKMRPPFIPAADRGEARERKEREELFLSTLLPRSTRPISMPVIALLLGGFLLVVGPLDWLLLGALRRRRWTWVVFPLAAAGCTALVIEAAGRALGREDHRSALLVTDVGAGGRVLRESRFDLLFTARNRDARSEIRNALAVPSTLGSGRYLRRGSDENSEPAAFSGQVPARFAMRQQLRQWTPQFNRVTSLEGSAGPADTLPWPEIEAALADGADISKSLRLIVSAQPALTMFLLHGEANSPIANFGTDVPPGLAELCRGPKSGLAGFFSRSSPDASADAGDLPLLDAGDPDEWLLVILQRTPDGVHLHRRLFRTDD